MIAIDALADPVRRYVIEVLATGERSAGELTQAVADRFGISQPATSRHLRVLREAGLVRVRTDGARRLFTINQQGIEDVEGWLRDIRQAWTAAFSSLEAEVARNQQAPGAAPGEKP